MGDENNNSGIADGNTGKLDPETQKMLMQLAATDPHAYAQKLQQMGIDPDANTKIYEAARSAGNSLVDTASNVGKSLMNMFGGSSQPGEESKPLGNEISDNMQQVAKKMALKRLQNQSNSN